MKKVRVHDYRYVERCVAIFGAAQVRRGVAKRYALHGSRVFFAPVRREHSIVENTLLVYCGLVDLEHQLKADAAEKGWRVQYARADHATCPDFYRSVAKNEQATFVLLLSPLVDEWTGSEGGFMDLLQHGADVAGSATVSQGKYVWPVHRIRHQFWKLAYLPYANGSLHARAAK